MADLLEINDHGANGRCNHQQGHDHPAFAGQGTHAAVELAQQCDVVVVIGGAHSNNTRELVETCGRFCDRVHHVHTVADLREGWFHPEDTVGITAGTSTPDSVINDVESWLHARKAVVSISPAKWIS